MSLRIGWLCGMGRRAACILALTGILGFKDLIIARRLGANFWISMAAGIIPGAGLRWTICWYWKPLRGANPAH